MKEFNVTGICVPEEHYMADISKKLDQIIQMIEKNKYFTINRARQYGKTTTFAALNSLLSYVRQTTSAHPQTGDRFTAVPGLYNFVLPSIYHALNPAASRNANPGADSSLACTAM